jgi:hypothetical protein
MYFQRIQLIEIDTTLRTELATYGITTIDGMNVASQLFSGEICLLKKDFFMIGFGGFLVGFGSSKWLYQWSCLLDCLIYNGHH